MSSPRPHEPVPRSLCYSFSLYPVVIHIPSDQSSAPAEPHSCCWRDLFYFAMAWHLQGVPPKSLEHKELVGR